MHGRQNKAGRLIRPGMKEFGDRSVADRILNGKNQVNRQSCHRTVAHGAGQSLVRGALEKLNIPTGLAFENLVEIPTPQCGAAAPMDFRNRYRRP
jgi:hypothetical protein